MLSWFTLVLAVCALAMTALVLILCAEDDQQNKSTSGEAYKQQTAAPSSSSKEQVKKPAAKKPAKKNKKMISAGTRKQQPKVASRNAPAVSLCKAVDTLADQPVSAVKSTGSGYYAALIKQTNVKSVSQYGMPPA